MNFQTIRYLEWAKVAHEISPQPFDLSTSAMEPVPQELLGPLDGVRIHGNNAYGHPELKGAIARKYGVEAERVLCSVPGSSMANFLMAAASVAPGETALVEWPAYEPLWRMLEAIGARVEFLERAAPRYDIDLDRCATAFARGARLLVISNLMNPVGRLAARETVLGAGEIAARHGAHVLVDEVYLDGVFRDPEGARSAAWKGEASGIIVTSSLTKVYGLGGLRAGFAIGPAALIEHAYRATDYLGVEHPFVADELALRAFARLPALHERAAARHRTNLPILRAWAAARCDVRLTEPDGGFTTWLGLPKGLTSFALEPSLRERGVAVAPGHFFGVADHIRIGIGGPTGKLEEGLRRLSSVLDDHAAGARSRPLEVRA